MIHIGETINEIKIILSSPKNTLLNFKDSDLLHISNGVNKQPLFFRNLFCNFLEINKADVYRLMNEYVRITDSLNKEYPNTYMAINHHVLNSIQLNLVQEIGAMLLGVYNYKIACIDRYVRISRYTANPKNILTAIAVLNNEKYLFD